LIIGWFAKKVINLQKGLIFGFIIGLILAAIVASFPSENGNYYWLEIMIPGAIVGLILGFVTQKYGRSAALR
jgi:uncharacterized membrane protein YeaQ/YmgE (transglycosylase-associated protein family)